MKSQIQALNRTQPRLLMEKKRAGTMAHDYVRQMKGRSSRARCQAVREPGGIMSVSVGLFTVE